MRHHSHNVYKSFLSEFEVVWFQIPLSVRKVWGRCEVRENISRASHRGWVEKGLWIWQLRIILSKISYLAPKLRGVKHRKRRWRSGLAEKFIPLFYFPKSRSQVFGTGLLSIWGCAWSWDGVESKCTPKFCVTFVFHVFWVLQPPQEKLKTKLTQNFGGQIRCIMGDVQVANTYVSYSRAA